MDARDCTSTLWEAAKQDPLPRERSYVSHAMERLLVERAEQEAMQANTSHQFNIFDDKNSTKTPREFIDEECAMQSSLTRSVQCSQCQEQPLIFRKSRFMYGICGLLKRRHPPHKRKINAGHRRNRPNGRYGPRNR